MSSTVERVTSADGTAIAYERRGEGRPIIVVDGALCSRSFGPSPKLAPLLAPQFQVITFDRRGRGESGDTAPYSPEREVEDVAALVKVAGDGVSLYGSSSGAALAIRAVASGLPVQRLVIYETPFVFPDSPSPPPDRQSAIEQLVAAGRRGDAVKAFLRMVGVPAVVLPLMRIMPGVWSNLTAVAHTLPHDFALIGHSGAGKPLPAEISAAMAAIHVPTLVGVGGKSPPWMRHAMEQVAGAIAGAKLRVLDGQTHAVSAKAARDMLVAFLGGRS